MPSCSVLHASSCSKRGWRVRWKHLRQLLVAPTVGVVGVVVLGPQGGCRVANRPECSRWCRGNQEAASPAGGASMHAAGEEHVEWAAAAAAAEVVEVVAGLGVAALVGTADPQPCLCVSSLSVVLLVVDPLADASSVYSEMHQETT